MKRFGMLIAIGIAVTGLSIGYYANTPIQTAQANEVFMPRYVDVPKNGKELSLVIDLKSDKVLLSESSKDATVTIIKDTETYPVCKTREQEKKIVYVENTVRVNQLLNRYAPLKIPKLVIDYQKINGDRDQSSKRYIRAINCKLEEHRKCYDILFRS